MVPLAFRFHCWLLWPLQDQMIALVPGLVPCPLASRQNVDPPTVRLSAPEAVCVQDCPAWPLHELICICVPCVVLEFGSSRHLRARTACNGAPAAGVGLDGGGELGGGVPAVPP